MAIRLCKPSRPDWATIEAAANQRIGSGYRVPKRHQDFAITTQYVQDF